MKQLLHRTSAIVLCGCVASALLLAAVGRMNSTSIIVHAEETHWQPSLIVQEVPAGDADQIAASFVSPGDFEDVVVRLGPGLDGFARVIPSTLGHIEAGATVDFSIELTPPGNAGAKKLDSAISLETSDGSVIRGSRVPMTLIVTSPNLQGIDSNENGIWDYVDIFIRDNMKEDVWSASNQFVKALQDSLLSGSNPELASVKIKMLDRAVGCMYSVHPEDASRTIKQLEAHVFNTSIRSKAYIAFAEKLAGNTIYASVRTGDSQCDFP
jgi:hypothetical protein